VQSSEVGQSLIESAVFLWVAFLLFAYVVDASWLLYNYVVDYGVTSNVAFYAAQGLSSMANQSLPGEQYSNTSSGSPGNTSSDPLGQLWEQYMLLHGGTGQGVSTKEYPTYVSLCSPAIGVSAGAGGGPAPTKCAGDQFGSSNSYSGGAAYANKVDPESPQFNEIQLTVVQNISPPIPMKFFSANFFPWTQLTFNFYTRALQ
jgi:hypothetical protein